jgi:hypothetical protein
MCWQLMTNDVSWVCPTLRPLLSTIMTDPAMAPTKAYLYVQKLWPQISKCSRTLLGTQGHKFIQTGNIQN